MVREGLFTCSETDYLGKMAPHIPMPLSIHNYSLYNWLS